MALTAIAGVDWWGFRKLLLHGERQFAEELGDDHVDEGDRNEHRKKDDGGNVTCGEGTESQVNHKHTASWSTQHLIMKLEYVFNATPPVATLSMNNRITISSYYVQLFPSLSEQLRTNVHNVMRLFYNLRKLSLNVTITA